MAPKKKVPKKRTANQQVNASRKRDDEALIVGDFPIIVKAVMDSLSGFFTY